MTQGVRRDGGRRPTFTGKPTAEAVKAIISQVSVDLRSSPDGIINGRNRLSDSPARHEVWRRLKALGWSYSAIARAWGCDHTTIIHALSKGALRQLSTEHTEACVKPELSQVESIGVKLPCFA